MSQEKLCDCLVCLCNVPTDGRKDCPDCRRGNHMDEQGFRRDKTQPADMEMNQLGTDIAPRLEGF